MSNTHRYPLLKLANTCMVLAGMTLMFLGSNETMSAQIQETGQGSMLNVLHSSQGWHSAASTQTGGGLLALGMVLVLLGCCLHMLLVVRSEKPIPAKTLPKRKISGKDLSPTRQYLQMFWIVRK